MVRRVHGPTGGSVKYPKGYGDADEPAITDGEPSTTANIGNSVSDHFVPNRKHGSDKRNIASSMRHKAIAGKHVEAMAPRRCLGRRDLELADTAFQCMKREGNGTGPMRGIPRFR